MPTFYKYAERQAGSQVNWAGLGVDMAETLNEQERIREQKRVAIDDATNKTIEDINKLPRGEEANGNKIISDYADNMTQALLMQHRLMKAGRLNPKDYMLFNANAKSGTDQMFNLQTEYQKQYSVAMDRMKKGESQNAEVDLRAYYETFADLTKVKPVIDPTTGQVSLAIMEYDKNNVLQPTGKTTSVQSAFKGLSQKFDKFDAMVASKKISDNLGRVVRTSLEEGSLTKSGQIITLDYALQEPKTVEALNNYVESYLTNPYNTSSILTNDVGTYENVFSRDGSEKSSGNKIAWHVDDNGAWKPEFTADQKAVAKEYLTTQAKAEIAQSKTVKEFESIEFERKKLQIAERNARIAETNANTRLANIQQGTVDPRTIIGKVNFADTNDDGKVDANWTNPQRELKTLNTNYGPHGYQFQLSEDQSSILIYKAGKGKSSTAVKIPMDTQTMDAIYEYIINDKTQHPKELKGYSPQSAGGKKIISGF